MDAKKFTTDEAAIELGVSPSRVRQMIIDGTLKTERFGRAHVIASAAIEAARTRKTKPGPDTGKAAIKTIREAALKNEMTKTPKKPTKQRAAK